jgi:ABC-type sugar transport system permease subunit
VGWSLYLSFTEYSILSDPAFVGLKHYRNLVADPVFRAAISNTVYFVAVVVPGIVLSALGLALLVNRPLKGISVFRLAFFSPVLISMVIVGLIWQWVYNPVYGLANALMSLVGLPQQEWLGDPTLALPSIMVTSIWRMAGYYMIIFLAGLKDIPKTQYEAARIDGANSLQMLTRITVPLLRPAMFFVTVTAVIFSFKIFTQVYVMTSNPMTGGVNVGGPLHSTTVLGLYIYQHAFVHYQMGYASAAAFVLFAIVLALSIFQYRWFGKDGIDY